uniref:Uncharacterized protein n=1 Tax=Hot spring virus BHS2 TaxID=2024352 RepID=A0A2U7P6D9_9VIRU|nr:hypothetical protein [Hot spring virus BHS2]
MTGSSIGPFNPKIIEDKAVRTRLEAFYQALYEWRTRVLPNHHSASPASSFRVALLRCRCPACSYEPQEHLYEQVTQATSNSAMRRISRETGIPLRHLYHYASIVATADAPGFSAWASAPYLEQSREVWLPPFGWMRTSYVSRLVQEGSLPGYQILRDARWGMGRGALPRRLFSRDWYRRRDRTMALAEACLDLMEKLSHADA